MTLKIKIKGDKCIAEVLSDDLSNAIFKVWIEDLNGNKVEEAMLSRSDDQIK